MPKPAYSYGEPAGPFSARQLRDGDPYELSNGHAIKCMSAGERHAKANIQGGMVLNTDPAVRGRVGADAGIEWDEGKNLRAPDLVLGIEGQPGWSKKIPPLCVEYADRGQDEHKLREKIDDLLRAGVRYIWVVRLLGPLRVEVHQPGKRMRVVNADGALSAPGVLANTYTPRQLVDEREALQATLRNQLQALGYDSLDAVRAEGRREAEAERDQAATERDQAAAALRVAIFGICELLDIQVSAARRRRVEQMDVPALSALQARLLRDRRFPR